MVRLFIILILVVASISIAAQPDSLPTFREIIRFERSDIYVPPVRNEHFAFNPDSTQIVALADDLSASIWDVETGNVLLTLPLVFRQAQTGLTWSPDGRHIAMSTYQQSTQVWDAQTGDLRYELPGADGVHNAWSPDGERLITPTMQVYDANTGELLSESCSPWSLPSEVQWSPDGTKVALATHWTGDYLSVCTPEGERLDTYWAGRSLAWSPDSTRIATTGQIRAVSSGLPVAIIPHMDGAIVWHPNGDWVLSTTETSILIWHAETGELVTEWAFIECTDIRGLELSQDGKRLALSCQQILSRNEDGTVQLNHTLIIGEIMQ